ncbi:prepilin-type N-terminal cleavage/methylation domain-containing protein [Acidithiobacillus sp. M4-SHS-6]|uniref:type IV pilus modification PilV family protein n=1 Tax=Acidithiobacillus sp. M4-SHS-6 TaxID=3383024 RepID=UPI0039BDCEB5
MKNNSAIIADNEAGFTLIEVMIAIAIFAFGILALAYLEMSVQKLSANSQYITTANNAANQMTGYLWTALGNGSDTSGIMAYDNTSVTASGISSGASGTTLSNISAWQQTLLGLNSQDEILPDTGLPQATGQVTGIVCSAMDGSGNTCSASEPCACTANISISWQSSTGPESYQITVPVGF